MKTFLRLLSTSIVWRWICAISTWFGAQWQKSVIVTAFLSPSPKGIAVSNNSIAGRFVLWLRKALCNLYEKLGLERIFDGSVFTHTAIWCIFPVILSPVIPTMALLGLCAVACCSILLHLLRNRDTAIVYAPMNRYIWLYCALYFAGTLLSTSPKTSLPIGLLSIAFIATTTLMQNGITTKRALDGLISLLVFSATLVAVYGIYQFIFQAGYQSVEWIDNTMFTDITFRVPSTIGNPNMLGLFFIMTIPLGGARLLQAKTTTMRVVYFICCGLLCICMLLTFSRGAWLGLLFAGMVFVLLLNPRLLLLAPLALVLLYFVMPETIITRFTSIGDMADESTSYRVYIWLGTWDMLRDYWFCGIGPGDVAFNLVYPYYAYSSIIAPHTHNLFMQIITDVGISALVIFCIIIIQFFRQLCGAIARRESWDSRILQCACCAAVAGFMVQSMTDYSFYNYRIMFLFWALLAIGALAARRESLPDGGAPCP